MQSTTLSVSMVSQALDWGVGINGMPNGSASIELPMFNPSDGVLHGVRYTLFASVAGHSVAINDGASPAAVVATVGTYVVVANLQGIVLVRANATGTEDKRV